MRSFLVTLFAACAAVAAAGQASAQAPAPAPAAVPDQMPFDIPYGPSITADRAAQVVAAAVAEAKKSPRNWKLAIAVVDPNGELVYFYKMDQTQAASVAIARGEPARSAPASVRRVRNRAEPGRSLRPTLDRRWSRRVALRWSKAARSSARSAGGAAGDQDGVACKAGADTANRPRRA
jgi:hypothetical protein